MILKDEKVTLRPIHISDAQRFVAWLSDSEVNKYITRKPTTLQEELKWIRGLKKKKDDYSFAMDTHEGVHIGSISVVIDRRDKDAWFGILIGDKKFWDKGYGFHASKLIINYAFKKFKVHRVHLKVYSYNSRAIKVYKRLGFKKEGDLRDSVFYKGKFYNDICMSVLKSEWEKKWK